MVESTETLHDGEKARSGLKENGVSVTLPAGIELLSIERVRSGRGFRETGLMWRRIECTEPGKLKDAEEEKVDRLESETRVRRRDLYT